METHKEKHQPKPQATESTNPQTATEKRKRKKQGGRTDTRTKKFRAGQSAETVDSGQNKVVSTATMTAAIAPSGQETNSKEETEGAIAAATVQAARLDSQTQGNLSKKKEDMNTEKFLHTDYSDDVTKKTKSLQLRVTLQRQHPRESTEGQQVPGSWKVVKRGAVAKASETVSGNEEKGKDEVHGSEKRKNKKKKKEKKKRKMDNKKQSEEDPTSGMESNKAQQNSDQKEGTLHTGYVLDHHARNRKLSEAAKVLLQSLDEESTDSEPSLEARFQSIVSGVPNEDTMKQLCLKLHGVGITILHGPDGCGKTLTAQLMSHVLQRLKPGRVHWCTYSTLPKDLKVKHMNHTVFIMDNFLGHTSFEGFPKWRPVYAILRKNLDTNVHVLLVMRTSILQQALASTGADFADVLNASILMELSVDYQTMYKNMLPKAIDKPDFDAIPDIGFPVCCKLASSMPEKTFTKLFQNPRSFLHEFVKGLMENTAPLLSLGLLAVTEGYVNARELRNPARMKKSIYLHVLQSMKAADINKHRVAEIIDFYNETPGLVQVVDDFVSFTNEAVREAVLCALCESHAQFLAKHCSLRLLSRLALVTRDPEQTRDDDGKPMLPTSATEHFLQRLLNEMSLLNYRETLPSALFEHSSFQRGFAEIVSEKSLINTWLGTKDKKAMHFLFWASACKTVIEILVRLKPCRNKEAMRQGVVGSCYWGDMNMLKELLSKCSKDEKSFMLTAKINAYFKKVKNFNWDESPFHPEDSLLTLAAWRGKDDVVKELVAMKANVNSSGHNQLTALMHYCARRHGQMVEFLLENGASVDMQDDIGNTALHYALMGHLESFHDKLIHGQTLHVQNNQLRTPLVVACGSGAPCTVLDKLRHGAQQEELELSLQVASYKGKTAVVKYLFETENNSQPILSAKDGMDAVQALISAVACGKSEEIVKILLPKIKSRTDSKQHQKLCLLLCACKDDRAIKEFLLEVKASFDYDFPIILACIIGNKSVVEYLLENQSSKLNKHLVLISAACFGSWDFMKWALAATKLPVTMEVITHTMMFQNSELVKLLLTSCDTKTGNNPSFLHLAAQHDLLPVMKWLLDDKHMDVDGKDENGVTPLSVAIKFGRERAVKCLVNYDAKITEDIKQDLHVHRASDFKNDRLCKALEKTVQFLVEGESE